MELCQGLINVSFCLFLLNTVCSTFGLNPWSNKSEFIEFTTQIEEILLSSCLHSGYLLIELVLIEHPTPFPSKKIKDLSEE